MVRVIFLQRFPHQFLATLDALEERDFPIVRSQQAKKGTRGRFTYCVVAPIARYYVRGKAIPIFALLFNYFSRFNKVRLSGLARQFTPIHISKCTTAAVKRPKVNCTFSRQTFSQMR